MLNKSRYLFKRLCPHTIRRTTAVALRRATGDLEGVSKILGYSSLHTTRIYIAADKSRLAETLQSISLAIVPALESPWNPDANLITWLENL